MGVSGESPLTLTLSRWERELVGAWLRIGAVVSEELRHFWQGFCEWMPVPRGQAALGKYVKIGVQDTAGGSLFELFQERDSHFHGG
jgi:hypothetical protein